MSISSVVIKKALAFSSLGIASTAPIALHYNPTLLQVSSTRNSPPRTADKPRITFQSNSRNSETTETIKSKQIQENSTFETYSSGLKAQNPEMTQQALVRANAEVWYLSNLCSWKDLDLDQVKVTCNFERNMFLVFGRVDLVLETLKSSFYKAQTISKTEVPGWKAIFINPRNEKFSLSIRMIREKVDK